MIFGSSKDIACVFTKPDGTAERYHGEIDRYGVDIGFTNEGYMVWAVFAPGRVAKGALAGTYAGATADVAAGAGSGAKVCSAAVTSRSRCSRLASRARLASTSPLASAK